MKLGGGGGDFTITAFNALFINGQGFGLLILWHYF